MGSLQRPPLTVRDELELPGLPKEGSWLSDWVARLKTLFRVHAHLFPAVAAGEVKVNQYTTATKPTAAQAGVQAIIFVSDGGAGAKFQGSDGTSWLNLG